MRTMRTIGLVLVLQLIFTSNVFAGNEPSLFKEISRKAIIDLSDINLEDGANYTNVIFKVKNDRIKIIELDGSSRELKERVKSRLEKIVLNDTYDQERIYRYRFVFERE